MPEIKQLISFNEDGYIQRVNQLNNDYKSRLQTVITAYNAMGLPALVTADLPRLLNDTNDLIIDKMTNGQPLVLAGVTVKKSKAFEILEKPAGLENLKAAIQTLKVDHNFPITTFEIVAGVLQIIPAKLTAIEESYKMYATTQSQVDVLAQVQNIVTALTALKGLGVYFGAHGSEVIGDTLNKAIINNGNYAANKFTVNPDFIVNYPR